jgi:hypothetical protein
MLKQAKSYGNTASFHVTTRLFTTTNTDKVEPARERRQNL